MNVPMDHSQPDGRNATIDEPIAADGRPEPGHLYEVPARQGRACIVAAGQTIRIVNTHGTQVADFWAFDAGDLRHYLSMEHMRASLRRLSPRVGDALVSNRREPLLRLTDDTSPGIHDTLIACCDVHRYRQLGVAGYHDNCTDNLRMALLAIGLRAVEIPCPLNLWMNTPPAPDGTISWLPAVSSPGDHVEMRAEKDCVVAISSCPMDILPINGLDATPRPLHFAVF